MKTLKRKNLRKKIYENRGRYFSAIGIKRSDGSRYQSLFRVLWHANHRKNSLLVRKYVRGKIIGIRTLALEGVLYLKAGGAVYKIVDS
jgi:hypothetical protein